MLSTWSFDHVSDSPTLYFAALYVPFDAGVLLTCVLISRRFGTGRFSSDFGWRFELGDLWRGPLLFLLAGIASAIARLPWVNDPAVSRTTDQFERDLGALPVTAIVLLALTAVISAPLLEELAFRGILQRSLTQRFGLGPAILLQGVCFGAAHLAPGLGRYNYFLMAGITTFGIAFGIAAARWRRLGPGIIAHMVTNAIFVIAVVANR